ncbi:MAG TPA: amylo-alpha-1,6-glucosidase [Geminicoccaceae bacterium]|nr:amylo-alpha-1,6-glucosidase [Geminicoccaceae bacterium]
MEADDRATAPHYITAAISLPERRLRTLKFGDAFAVLDPFGDIPGEPGAPEGIYLCDTRVLSRWQLQVAGARPLLLGSAVRNDNAFLVCDLTNPDLLAGERIILPREHLHLRRVGLLAEDGYVERLVIRNFGREPLEIALHYLFAADFVDLFEVRGEQRPRRGRLLAADVAGREVQLAYVGLDGVERAVRLGFDPEPRQLDGHSAQLGLRLPPGQDAIVRAGVGFTTDRPAPGFTPSLRQAHRVARRHLALLPWLTASEPGFGELLRRSRSDLAMLLTDKPEGPYPYAGIPWFSTVFGRDAIITALFTLWLAPEIARGVLRFLAANQALAEDPRADAEPGKILHETRGGEMARLGEVPFGRYYGSIDATPLFVVLAAAYLDRTADLATARELWPAVEWAIGWLERYGDRDGDGFVEYGRRSDQGLLNQGWKDSQDSVSHADGSLAEGPIALVEVQAYVYGAYRGAARIAAALGEAERAAAWEDAAARLRERFEAVFWCERLDAYALALDGAKRQCEVLSSNTGHALLTGLAAPDRAARVAARLLGPEGWSGWGVRTLGAGEVRFNPMSYHNGSVWPHDNALLALGLARYGLRDGALQVLTGLTEAAAHFERRRLPELFCGFQRRHRSGPVAYPVACSPQAWAAATPYALVQACLGLSFDPGAREVRLERPRLPAWLERLEVYGLALGDGMVDLVLDRSAEGVAVRALGRHGDMRVVAA